MLMIHKFRDSTRGLDGLLTGLGALFTISYPGVRAPQTPPTTKLPPPRNDASCGAQFGVARRFIMVHGSQCRTATRLWVENVKSNHPPQSKPFMHVRPTNEKSSRSLKSWSGSRGSTSSFDVGRLSDSEGLEEKERQINGDALAERRLVPEQLKKDA
ncbi:Extracellular serine-rich protein [Fusarium oxysporum f. sp. albedinis]|nr:Extracellular serine-rich protein [Fusarium oxysporum f. sp. albedinis]